MPLCVAKGAERAMENLLNFDSKMLCKECFYFICQLKGPHAAFTWNQAEGRRQTGCHFTG